VAITYDIIKEYTLSAIEKAGCKDIAGFRTDIKSAERFLVELMRALDYNYPIAAELLSIYEFIQRVFIKSEVKGENCGLEIVPELLNRLGGAFHEISSQDDSGAVLDNSQQIYAGLTYGKGTLNEADMAAGSNRGFLA